MNTKYFLGIHTEGKCFLTPDVVQVSQSVANSNGIDWFGVEAVEGKAPKLVPVEIKASATPLPETEVVSIEVGGVVVGEATRLTQAEIDRQKAAEDEAQKRREADAEEAAQKKLADEAEARAEADAESTPSDEG